MYIRVHYLYRYYLSGSGTRDKSSQLVAIAAADKSRAMFTVTSCHSYNDTNLRLEISLK